MPGTQGGGVVDIIDLIIAKYTHHFLKFFMHKIKNTVETFFR